MKNGFILPANKTFKSNATPHCVIVSTDFSLLLQKRILCNHQLNIFRDYKGHAKQNPKTAIPS